MHCIAGMGRSGSVILAYIGLEHYRKTKKNKVLTPKYFRDTIIKKEIKENYNEGAWEELMGLDGDADDKAANKILLKARIDNSIEAIKVYLKL